MNETVNKSLLAGGKFMPEMHLRQKKKERIKKLKKQTIQDIFIKTN